jgi:hypothetical protein
VEKREEWFASGPVWWDRFSSPPSNWDPIKQMENSGNNLKSSSIEGLLVSNSHALRNDGHRALHHGKPWEWKRTPYTVLSYLGGQEITY